MMKLSGFSYRICYKKKKNCFYIIKKHKLKPDITAVIIRLHCKSYFSYSIYLSLTCKFLITYNKICKINFDNHLYIHKTRNFVNIILSLKILFIFGFPVRSYIHYF